MKYMMLSALALTLVVGCKKSSHSDESASTKESSASASKDRTYFSFRVPLPRDWSEGSLASTVGKDCEDFDPAKLESKGYLLPLSSSLSAPAAKCQHIGMLVSGSAQLAIVPFAKDSACAANIESVGATYDDNNRTYSFNLSSQDVQKCDYVLMVNLLGMKPQKNPGAMRPQLFMGGAVLENKSSGNVQNLGLSFKNANNGLIDFGFKNNNVRFVSPSDAVKSADAGNATEVDFTPGLFSEKMRAEIEELLN